MLEKFITQINLGIDGQDDDDGIANNKEEDGFNNVHNTRNNATTILEMGASNDNTTIKSPEMSKYHERKQGNAPHISSAIW